MINVASGLMQFGQQPKMSMGDTVLHRGHCAQRASRAGRRIKCDGLRYSEPLGFVSHRFVARQSITWSTFKPFDLRNSFCRRENPSAATEALRGYRDA